MIGRPVAAAHLVLGLLAARLGPLDSHTPHLGEPGCAEEGRPVMGVSAAMFKWGAGPRDHTRNVQGLVMLYNIKTTYTLHGACACNPETVLKTRRGGDARALQGSLESKRLCQAEPQSNMHCQPAHTQPSITRCGTGMRMKAAGLWAQQSLCVLAAQTATRLKRKNHRPQRRRGAAVAGACQTTSACQPRLQLHGSGRETSSEDI